MKEVDSKRRDQKFFIVTIVSVLPRNLPNLLDSRISHL